jgi:hypothetical protein
LSGHGAERGRDIAGGPEGIDLSRQAVATLENTPARLEYARALIDLGGVLRRQNHRKEAREPLRQGTELAQHCGATVLTQRGQALPSNLRYDTRTVLCSLGLLAWAGH